MPYAVWNNYDAKYFALTLTDVSVTRNFSANSLRKNIKHRLSLVNGVQTRQLIHWNQMYSMTCTL